ncbi:MAG: GNAT family N-acetyltransferase [bacterium]
MSEIRTTCPDDREWVQGLLVEHWGETRVVSRGRVHQAELLPGFVAVRDGARCGLLTYRVEGGELEVVSLNALTAGQGVGTSLLVAAAEAAREAGCRRLWLITTNDNLAALRFYQRRGLHLAALHRSALDVSRRLKPSIPRLGIDGIPLRDELELEVILGNRGDSPGRNSDF